MSVLACWWRPSVWFLLFCTEANSSVVWGETSPNPSLWRFASLYLVNFSFQKNHRLKGLQCIFRTRKCACAKENVKAIDVLVLLGCWPKKTIVTTALLNTPSRQHIFTIVCGSFVYPWFVVFINRRLLKNWRWRGDACIRVSCCSEKKTVKTVAVWC